MYASTSSGPPPPPGRLEIATPVTDELQSGRLFDGFNEAGVEVGPPTALALWPSVEHRPARLADAGVEVQGKSSGLCARLATLRLDHGFAGKEVIRLRKLVAPCRDDRQILPREHVPHDVEYGPPDESSRPSCVVDATDIERSIKDRLDAVLGRPAIRNVFLRPIELPVAHIVRQVEMLPSDPFIHASEIHDRFPDFLGVKMDGEEISLGDHSCSIDMHDLAQAGPVEIISDFAAFERLEQIERLGGINARPIGVGEIMGGQPVILRLSLTPHIVVADGSIGDGVRTGSPFGEQADPDALFDVEDVDVPAAVGRSFLLFEVAVQVEGVDVVERVHKRPAHATVHHHENRTRETKSVYPRDCSRWRR